MATDDTETKDLKKDAKDLASSVHFDHSELYTGKVSKQRKISAAVAYVLSGTAAKAAEVANVSKPTILDWKNNSDWWPHLIAHIKEKHDEDIEARTTNILTKALDEVEDRIEHGDQIMNYKTGEMEYKPISGKDLTIIFGTLYDKRQLMRREPTAISDNTSEDQRLQHLMQEFIKFSEAKQIDGEYERVETNS